MRTLTCLAFVAACGGGAPASRPSSIRNDSAPANAPPPTVRAVDWKNFTYQITMGEEPEPWTVHDGYAERTDQFEEGEAVKVDDPVYGDVDHDGTEEALVRVMYSGGGTGRWDSVRVFRATPAGPREVAVIPGGDRGDGGIQSFTIENGEVLVVRYAVQDGDGECCASMVQHERWRWSGSQMVEDEKARQLKPLAP